MRPSSEALGDHFYFDLPSEKVNQKNMFEIIKRNIRRCLGHSPETSHASHDRVGELPDDFDAEDYLSFNPDLRKACVDPVWHYLNHGRQEKRHYKNTSKALMPMLNEPYDFDGLYSSHNHDFMMQTDFLSAYERGVKASGKDYQWYWRVHVGLWAARSALRVEGDFVECGVNRGFLSSAIMHSLDWDKTGKTFYLLDTFAGIDERFVSTLEKEGGVLNRNKRNLDAGFYTVAPESVRRNFSEWSNIKIVVGSIPETLDEVTSQKIAFLHIDLNCSPPEIATIDTLWKRMEKGGIVLLDDYAYHGYQPQKEGMDAWASCRGLPIASLPTGQGLIIKI